MVIMSKKEVPLPKRPQPPKVEDIVEDIDDTDSNDVVFQRNNDVAAGKIPIIAHHNIGII